MIKEFDHFSYSNVSLWYQCPRAWYIRYVEEILPASSNAQLFGTAVHNAIENDMLNKTSIAHKSFEQHLKQAVKERGNGNLFPQEDFKKMCEEAETIFGDPMVQWIIEGVNAIEIERYIEFRVPNVPVPIIGYIDVVCDDGVPLDIKTSWNDWGNTRARTELQPNFYLYAMDILNIAGKRHGGRFRHLVVVKRTDAPRAYVLETRRDNYIETVDSMVQTMWAGIKDQAWSYTTYKCHNPRCVCHQRSW